MSNTIPIFFSSNDDYAPWLGVAMHSLVMNADPSRDYTIVVLDEDLSEEHKAKLRALVEGKDNFELRIVSMEGKIEGVFDRLGNRLRTDYFTMTIFFRLFIPTMFPEWDKGIYLDADIVVPGDISQMYDIDLDGKLVGACHDRSIAGVPELVEYVGTAIGVGIQNYVNSGILLMDMKALREHRLAERFLELFKTYHFESIAPDQDYLNALCFERIHFMPDEWDVMPIEGSEDFQNPKLIHYNLFDKPWCYDDVQYGDYFWKYAEDSGFLEEARSFKDNYPEEQKKRDAESMNNLIEMSVKLVGDSEHNFASVFNTGKEPRL